MSWYYGTRYNAESEEYELVEEYEGLGYSPQVCFAGDSIEDIIDELEYAVKCLKGRIFQELDNE